MKLIFCATLVSIVEFSIGTTVLSGILAARLSTDIYSNGLFLEKFESLLGFGYNAPFSTSNGSDTPCFYRITDEVISDYQIRIFKFITLALKQALVSAEGHFAFSPYTAWLSLSALAEGTEGPTRAELFKVLNLPEDRCLRQIFYTLASTREYPSPDVILARNRLFLTDSSLQVNRNWENLARCTNLNTVAIPFKSQPEQIEGLRREFKAQLPDINLSGNSFLLESLDYHGFWTSAFYDAVIETRPFYSSFGEQIGTVEYMKTMKIVNIAYVASANIKVIEIPVGRDERYKMLFGLPLGNIDHVKTLGGIEDNLVIETLADMKPTPAPIEIVVPRLTMTTEMELRKVLNIGIESLWTDATATRNISKPAALPSSFIQRVTVTLDNIGVRHSVPEYYNFVPPLKNDNASDSDIYRNFIANRPFSFGIFDSETYTLLFAATFSKPERVV